MMAVPGGSMQSQSQSNGRNEIMDVTFRRYDPADLLKSNADIAAYLDAAAEDGDTAVIAAALGDVVRARNISELSR